MANDIEESSNRPPVTPSSSTENANIDAGDFECNICFDLPQDPIVTLCGHLFCWPCLYRWLHHHSHCQECPVCKALVEEDKLVPLYGRGKTHTDPRSKPIPGTEIPRRPMGQRPQTAPSPEASNFPNVGLGHMGGFVPMATARFGNFAFSAGFGGLFPSIFNIQVHGYPNGTGYGTGFPHGISGGFHGPRAPNTSQGVRENNVLKNIFIVIGLLLIFSLIWG